METSMPCEFCMGRKSAVTKTVVGQRANDCQKCKAEQERRWHTADAPELQMRIALDDGTLVSCRKGDVYDVAGAIVRSVAMAYDYKVEPLTIRVVPAATLSEETRNQHRSGAIH